MNNQLIQNIRQQTKRLLDQLQQLEDNKADLTQEEYNEMKQSTKAELQTFQTFLSNCQKGDQLLQSQIEKSKKQIMEAVKNSFDKNAIMANVLKNQVVGLRSKIKYLDDAFNLKKIQGPEYFGKKRKLLVEIQETGQPLSQEQSSWLELNHFDSKGDISDKAGSKYLEIAGENIKNLQ